MVERMKRLGTTRRSGIQMTGQMTLPQEPELPLHNPWSYNCYRHLQGEPYKTHARCPVCDKPYVIDEQPSA